MKDNIILIKIRKFWILISKYYLNLKDKRYFEIASQLFRSWTSIWANVSEAQWAVSNNDFINKLSIALKESYEVDYWFYILENGFDEKGEDIWVLKKELNEIISILTKIIKSSKIK